MKLALSVLALTVSGVVMAEQNACNLSRYKVCVETADFDLSEECGDRGGAVATTCATENRLGSCEKKESGATMYLRYYNGFGTNPQKHCVDNNGKYIPN